MTNLSLHPPRVLLSREDASNDDAKESSSRSPFRFRSRWKEVSGAARMRRECNASAPNRYALADQDTPLWIVIFPHFLVIKIFLVSSRRRLFAFFLVSLSFSLSLLPSLLSWWDRVTPEITVFDTRELIREKKWFLDAT